MTTESWHDGGWKLNGMFDALLVFDLYDQDPLTNI